MKAGSVSDSGTRIHSLVDWVHMKNNFYAAVIENWLFIDTPVSCNAAVNLKGGGGVSRPTLTNETTAVLLKRSIHLNFIQSFDYIQRSGVSE